uniref:Uncharacterized protein n=1 Tax=Brassica campestris TaxID=3711 RepID=M4EBK8_BRACM
MVVANDNDLSTSKILHRVLIVSRRTLRKNKFVDFVGEYHLDLIVSNGAVPVIVPRVSGIHSMLKSFEPIHGVLLCEGEDVDPSLYADAEQQGLSQEDMEEIRSLHASDTAIDIEKDSIELTLAKLCLERNIPFLGICRGSQILNVAAGGTLYQDIDKEIGTTTKHIDYDNYDDHRHEARVVEETPLHKWFDEMDQIMVNSYHHQAVKRLGERFVPMAYAPDGLIEGFYDPKGYNPEEGRFLVGLQFHPERMRLSGGSDEFDYPGCATAYQEFVKAVTAFQKKQLEAAEIVMELKTKKKRLVKSFSMAELLEASNTALSKKQENRLKQMGATVRNSCVYMKRKEVQERAMDKLSADRLSDLLSFHRMMARLCSDAIKRKLLEVEPTET